MRRLGYITDVFSHNCELSVQIRTDKYICRSFLKQSATKYCNLLKSRLVLGFPGDVDLKIHRFAYLTFSLHGHNRVRSHSLNMTQRMWTELLKFSLYVAVPVGAFVFFSDPDRVAWAKQVIVGIYLSTSTNVLCNFYILL